jgi:hypothetical protein
MSDSFTLVINSGNLSNPNTNGTYTYNFIGGGFTIDYGFEVMLSSAQITFSILNITSAYNNNKFTLAFPLVQLLELIIILMLSFLMVFILLKILIHICNNSQLLMVYI